MGPGHLSPGSLRTIEPDAMGEGQRRGLGHPTGVWRLEGTRTEGVLGQLWVKVLVIIIAAHGLAGVRICEAPNV